MAIHRLTLRVGLPFVLLVLLVAVALAMLLTAQADASDSARMRRLAISTRQVVEPLAFDANEAGAKLAEDLRGTTGYDVYFRRGDRVDPPPPPELGVLDAQRLPADASSRRAGNHEFVALAIPGKRVDLLFVRTTSAGWLQLAMFAAIAAMLLAIATAWLVVRGLVRPLRHLARQLPQIEQPGPIHLPEAGRRDEIGDLARAFLRTRKALTEEQEARERAEKLAVLGRMTAALAHEVQNPVAAIRMHAQLLREPADDDPDSPARTIEHEAKRIECLLNQWMFLTRPDPPVVVDVDVGALLARVVAMHQAQARHTAVTIDLDATEGLVASADGRRLDQVFRNLLTNALQAMPTGGTLTIRARENAGQLHVTFADSGAGFSGSALQHVGEFFYSEREGGMGIGLSVAIEILKAHGGSLRVANGKEGGAIVSVQLPASSAAQSHAAIPVVS